MEPKFVELIHGEIDGTNSETESADLRDFLARDAEGRELYADLTRVASFLDRIEELDAPADLRATIRERIQAEGGIQARPRQSQTFGSWLASWIPSTPTSVRYVGAVAAGLFIGVVAFQLVSNQPPVDPADIRGTMAPRGGIADFPQQLILDQDGLTGTVTATPSDSVAVLAFDLSCEGPVEISLGFDAQASEFGGFRREAGEVSSVQTGAGQVLLKADPVSRFTVLLQRREKIETTVDLEFFRAGKPALRESIRIPGTDERPGR